MMIVLTYDIETLDEGGSKRLRKVAKVCESYGIRVQNSTFELLIDPAQYAQLKIKIGKIIDEKTDSVRFYRLGSSWHGKIETLGVTPKVRQEDTIIL